MVQNCYSTAHIGFRNITVNTFNDLVNEFWISNENENHYSL